MYFGLEGKVARCEFKSFQGCLDFNIPASECTEIFSCETAISAVVVARSVEVGRGGNVSGGGLGEARLEDVS